MNTDSVLGSISLVAQDFRTGVQHAISQFEGASELDQYAGELSYLEIIMALGVAAILGALIAYHPRRNIEFKGPVTDQELRKTQIVICVAGAIMVALIQGSLERAFGLVGLGSFVRYRTALRNPYDLSVIFILIGLGMACGLQYYEFALTITCFFYVLMFLLDIKPPAKQNIWTYRIDTPEPNTIERAFQQVVLSKKIDIVKMKTDNDLGRFICKFSTNEIIDKDEFHFNVKELCGNEELILRFDWEQEVKST